VAFNLRVFEVFKDPKYPIIFKKIYNFSISHFSVFFKVVLVRAKINP